MLLVVVFLCMCQVDIARSRLHIKVMVYILGFNDHMRSLKQVGVRYTPPPFFAMCVLIGVGAFRLRHILTGR